MQLSAVLEAYMLTAHARITAEIVFAKDVFSRITLKLTSAEW